MNEERARELLGKAIRKGDDCSLYLNDGHSKMNCMRWFGTSCILLDGQYTSDELEAIAWWMRNKGKP